MSSRGIREHGVGLSIVRPIPRFVYSRHVGIRASTTRALPPLARPGPDRRCFVSRLPLGLVDELHRFVYPLTRESGPRLFPEEAAPGNLSLTACESYENGVVYLAYRPQA